MNWRSISSVAMKSAITPSRMGRTISTGSGVLPCMALALQAHRQHHALAAAHLHGHHRGLVDDDAATHHVHQRVRCAEIDRDIVGKCARNARDHGCHCMNPRPGTRGRALSRSSPAIQARPAPLPARNPD